jgi:hypothetical protein
VVFVKGDSRSDIIINFHHVIVDGSGALVFRDLLSFCGQLLQGAHPTVQNPGLPPLIDHRIPKQYRGMINTRRIVDFLKKRITKRTRILRQLPQKEPDYPLEKRITRFILHSLSREETQRLLEVCRNHKTTFYGATAAAFLLAANRQVQLREGEHLALSNAISLRSYLEPPLGDEICCCAVGGILTSHSVAGTTDFWDLAVSIRADLRDAIDRGELFYPGFLLRRIFLRLARSQERFIRTLSKGTKSALMYSSIGVFRIPTEYGGLRLRSLITFPSLHVCKVIGLLTTTFDGVAHFDFLYPDPVIERSVAEYVADNAMAILREKISRG